MPRSPAVRAVQARLSDTLPGTSTGATALQERRHLRPAGSCPSAALPARAGQLACLGR